MKPPKAYKPTEHQVQSAIISWARWNEGKYPALKRLHKVTNEGTGSAIRGKRMKEEGVLKGVSDLFLAFPTEGILLLDLLERFHGLYLEVKAPGKKPTYEQSDWIIQSRKLGYDAHWCDSVDGGIKIIKDYLGIMDYENKKEES